MEEFFARAVTGGTGVNGLTLVTICLHELQHYCCYFLYTLDEMEYMCTTKPELGFSGSDLLQINLDTYSILDLQ